MSRFVYRPASSLEETVALLAEIGSDGKILAGGQSLIPLISMGLARPGVLVDIGRIEGLDGVTADGKVQVGPLVRHRALERASGPIADAAPLLPPAAANIGHAAIRNRGTFLGSVAHGDPAAEWPAVCLAVDATLVARSVRGERSIPAREFFLGPLTTALADDEIVVKAHWPCARPRTGVAVRELTYRHGDYAIVGVAAQVTAGPGDAVADVRLALFGVGPTPVRAAEAERLLRDGGAAAIPDAARAAQLAADPWSDVSASADYRRDMVLVFARRALEAAIADAVGRPRTAAPGGT